MDSIALRPRASAMALHFRSPGTCCNPTVKLWTPPLLPWTGHCCESRPLLSSRSVSLSLRLQTPLPNFHMVKPLFVVAGGRSRTPDLCHRFAVGTLYTATARFKIITNRKRKKDKAGDRKLRDNTKLMGISNWLTKTHRIEAVSKARHDKCQPKAYSKEQPQDDILDDDEPMRSANAKYTSWLKKHPSALSSFEGMMSGAKRKRIVVFLDYDGTLSPIVNDPDQAFMSDLMRSAVREVATRFPTAIISGRSREKVYGFVKLDEVYYAGSHGMDIMGPAMQLESVDRKYQTKALDKRGNELTIFQPAQDFLPQIKKMLSELKETTSDVNGVLIEDNMFCISVHHRNVLEEDYGLLEKKVDAVLSKYPKFHLTKGLKVLEIRPSIKFNKGDALVYLLKTLGFANSKNVLPFYIGDDNTDEDAFKVLKSRKLGCPIIVSSVPRESVASYSLRNPSEVQSFLMRLARWGGDHSSH